LERNWQALSRVTAFARVWRAVNLTGILPANEQAKAIEPILRTLKIFIYENIIIWNYVAILSDEELF
jgi:hypothetical protein